MKKLTVLVLGTFFASTMFAFPLHADEALTTTASVPLSEEAISCMQAAITVRDEALGEAYDAFSETAKGALETRKEGLAEAWGMGTVAEIRTALAQVWQTYRRSIVMARIDLRRAKRSAWKEFRETRATCLPGTEAQMDTSDVNQDAQL